MDSSLFESAKNITYNLRLVSTNFEIVDTNFGLAMKHFF